MDVAPIQPPKSRLAQTQENFTRYLRNPTEVPIPEGLDSRRMRVYQELVYENILSLLSGFFPVMDGLFSEQHWRQLIAEFIRDFKAETPYFPKLGEEFIFFLSARDGEADDFPFLLELAHYEWIELELYMSEETRPDSISDELLDRTKISLSPLATPLAYHYPVHRISKEFKPLTPPEEATYLLVFRDEDDQVRFYELQLLNYQLLVQIGQSPGLMPREYLQTLCPENHPDADDFCRQGMSLISKFNDMGLFNSI